MILTRVITVIFSIAIAVACSSEENEENKADHQERVETRMDVGSIAESRDDKREDYPILISKSKKITLFGRYLGASYDVHPPEPQNEQSAIYLYFDLYVESAWDKYVDWVEANYGRQPELSRFIREQTKYQAEAILKTLEYEEFFKKVKFENGQGVQFMMVSSHEPAWELRDKYNYYMIPDYRQHNEIRSNIQKLAQILSDNDFAIEQIRLSEKYRFEGGGSYASLFISENHENELVLVAQFGANINLLDLSTIQLSFPTVNGGTQRIKIQSSLSDEGILKPDANTDAEFDRYIRTKGTNCVVPEEFFSLVSLRLSRECLSFTCKGADGIYLIKAREVHNASCGGDPSVSPRYGMWRYFATQGKVYEYRGELDEWKEI